jgi:hypothetical protein
MDTLYEWLLFIIHQSWFGPWSPKEEEGKKGLLEGYVLTAKMFLLW